MKRFNFKNFRGATKQGLKIRPSVDALMGHACRYKYPSIFVGAQVQTPKVISLSPGIVKTVHRL